MIKSVRLVNFFSFGDCTIDLEPDMNVLVGINGSGKSNLLKAFQLLKAGMDGKLREEVAKWGGYSSIRNKSENKHGVIGRIIISIEIDAKSLVTLGYEIKQNLTYTISLSVIQGSNLVGTVERVDIADNNVLLFGSSILVGGAEYNEIKSSTRRIPLVPEDDAIIGELLLPKLGYTGIPELKALAHVLRDLDLYKLFNTTEDAPMRTTIRATGVDKLLPNGDNMFQVLNVTGLKSTAAYDAIEAGLHDVNEHFQRFRMNVYGQGIVEFYLQEKGLETPIHAAQVSDGTLSYLCLLVALHQPNRGSVIIFDEPERNLHPDMLLELGKQLEKASEKSQLILTTHAPGLLNQFPLRAVRVFEKDENNQTQVRQFTEEDFAGWYESFAPGQMWRDGALGGNRY